MFNIVMLNIVMLSVIRPLWVIPNTVFKIMILLKTTPLVTLINGTLHVYFFISKVM